MIQSAPPTAHPSYLELDRYALGSGDPQTKAHVERCARCADHVLAVKTASGAVPDWVAPLTAAGPTRKRTPRARLFALPLGFAALAAAAGVLLSIGRPQPEAVPYVGSKGSPAVALLVSRGQAVSVWHGEALAAGDRIRIEVAAENYGHVAVFHEDAQRNTLLFQGVVAPHARTLLPRAWQLDAAETPERLAVVFSDAALDPRAAEALLRSAETAQHYVVRVVIEKGTKGE